MLVLNDHIVSHSAQTNPTMYRSWLDHGSDLHIAQARFTLGIVAGPIIVRIHCT